MDKCKKKLLLHSCCGPCSTTALERLTEDYSVTVFYYNPCIHPESEYLKRKFTQLDCIAKFNLKNNCKVEFIDSDYDSQKFFERVKGLEKEPEGGARCEECFKQRLSKTAETAKQLGFDLFATTLSVSPHKNSNLINSIGESLGKEHGVEYLETNLKKQNGYFRSVELSKEFGLYRQNYCGCVYSMRGEING